VQLARAPVSVPVRHPQKSACLGYTEIPGNDLPVNIEHVSRRPAGTSGASLVEQLRFFGAMLSMRAIGSGVCGRFRGFGYVDTMVKGGDRLG
jgi:hypothetical protein